mgnify:CR=1 FL=1
MNFTDKKVSIRRAIAILARNGIEVDDDEANVIGIMYKTCGVEEK